MLIADPKPNYDKMHYSIYRLQHYCS